MSEYVCMCVCVRASVCVCTCNIRIITRVFNAAAQVLLHNVFGRHTPRVPQQIDVGLVEVLALHHQLARIHGRQRHMADEDRRMDKVDCQVCRQL